MAPVKAIEQQIEELDDDSFAELRAWFLEYEEVRWDRQIEADSAAGRLDSLIEEALAEDRAGKTTPL
jgi:hypothetical protein